MGELRHWIPWSFGEVMSLNGYQKSGVFHEFTCGGEHERSVALKATRDGWRCPEGCGYEQEWAWPWMADWSWVKFKDRWENGRTNS